MDQSLDETHLAQLHGAARVENVCTAKDWPSKDAYEEYRDACKELRELVDQHQPHPFDDNAALETARLGLELLKLTAQVAAAYDERKRTQGKLDFDDLLANAYALLANPENADLRDRLADDLRLLLVDEFQDTDQLQVNLVTSVCGQHFDTGRLFFVGDFKQSIYRFRGAAAESVQRSAQSSEETGPPTAHAQLPQPARDPALRQCALLRHTFRRTQRVRKTAPPSPTNDQTTRCRIPVDHHT